MSRDWIVPAIEGLAFDMFPLADEKFLATIRIPAQRARLQPFLVRGAMLDATKYSGAAVTVVRRIGDRKVPLTAEVIHALMAAGQDVTRERDEVPVGVDGPDVVELPTGQL